MLCSSLRAALATAALTFPSLLVFACSTSSPMVTTHDAAPPVCTGPYVASSAPTPVVTIAKADVDAVIGASCTFTHSCHGDGSPASRLQLPKPPSDWAKNIINVDSNENPAMKIVYLPASASAPVDPAKSWLVQKITNGSCSFTAACKKDTTGCGDQMPQTGDPLVDSDMTTLVEWIRQGAVTK